MVSAGDVFGSLSVLSLGSVAVGGALVVLSLDRATRDAFAGRSEESDEAEAVFEPVEAASTSE